MLLDTVAGFVVPDQNLEAEGPTRLTTPPQMDLFVP